VDRDLQARRRRGLALGGAGIILLFVPAVLLALVPSIVAPFAIVPMIAGMVLLLAGFFALPGSLGNLLRPKP